MIYFDYFIDTVFHMSLLSSLLSFLIYLRLHKGRSRKTQEQYAFHIWRFICYMIPEASSLSFWGTKNLPEIGADASYRQHDKSGSQVPRTKNQESRTLKPHSPLDFLPPLDKDAAKNWKSPLIELGKNFREPIIEDIKKEDFDTWRLSLADSGLSVKTVNAHIITIRSWLKYLKKQEINCLDPTTLDLMKVADREVTFLTNEEITRFFEAIPRETIQWKRDYAIAECIYSTWLRISELTALDKGEVNFETLEFAVRGKWGKLRVVYLTDQAKVAIQDYLNARIDGFSPLFIRHNFSEENINSSLLSDESVRLTRFFITNMIKDYGLKAGILKNMHAHTLRHSFATTLLTNGADIRIIQELLWHTSITTTQVYTHVTNPKLKEAHKKFHK